MRSAVIDEWNDEAGGPTEGMRQAIGYAWRTLGVAGAVVTIAAVTACAVVTGWWWPDPRWALATGTSLAVLVPAALVDAVEHRLPNELVALAGLPIVLALGLAWSPDVTRGALAGAALVGVPLLATHLVSPAGMGFGDVKAGAVLGAGLGLVEPQLAVFALVAALAGGALWGLLRRARAIPLGPALVAGAIAAMAIGRLLGVEPR